MKNRTIKVNRKTDKSQIVTNDIDDQEEGVRKQ
jgi:hypothetical protein